MSTLVGEVLETWRQAERLVEHLPPTEPERETAAQLADELRSMYRSLTDIDRSSPDEIAAGRNAVARSRALLDTIASETG